MLSHRSVQKYSLLCVPGTTVPSQWVSDFRFEDAFDDDERSHLFDEFRSPLAVDAPVRT